MKKENPLRIAYFVGKYPETSKTFITDQVAEVVRRGHDVTLYAEPSSAEFVGEHGYPEVDLTQRLVTITEHTTRLGKIGSIVWRTVVNIPTAVQTGWGFFSRLFRGELIGAFQYLYWGLQVGGPKKFDIVHGHFGRNCEMAVRLKSAGVLSGPLVAQFHGADTRRVFAGEPGVFDRTFRNAEVFLAITSYNEAAYQKRGVSANKIEELPNAIPVERVPFKHGRKTDHTTRSAELSIVSVGRLAPEKGFYWGIETLGILRRRYSVDVCYTIVGDGPERAALEEDRERLGLNDSVHMPGALPRQDVFEELSRHDLYLLSSLEESFGVVLLEAQAAGLPVVATDVGGVSEALAPCNSDTVPPRNPEALAAKVYDRYQERSEWEDIGRRAREFVEEHFSTRAVGRRLEAIYRDVCDSGGSVDRQIGSETRDGPDAPEKSSLKS